MAKVKLTLGFFVKAFIILLLVACSTPGMKSLKRYEDFFPKLEDNPKQWDAPMPSYSLCIISDILRLVNDKPLYTLNTTQEEHYRVVYCDYSNCAVCIHILRSNHTVRIQCDGWPVHHGAYGFPRKSATAELKVGDIETLASKLEVSKFWQERWFPMCRPQYFHGGFWFIEAVKNGKYHMQIIETPTDKILEFCLGACHLARSKCSDVRGLINVIPQMRESKDQ